MKKMTLQIALSCAALAANNVECHAGAIMSGVAVKADVVKRGQ